MSSRILAVAVAAGVALASASAQAVDFIINDFDDNILSDFSPGDFNAGANLAVGNDGVDGDNELALTVSSTDGFLVFNRIDYLAFDSPIIDALIAGDAIEATFTSNQDDLSQDYRLRMYINSGLWSGNNFRALDSTAVSLVAGFPQTVTVRYDYSADTEFQTLLTNYRSGTTGSYFTIGFDNQGSGGTPGDVFYLDDFKVTSQPVGGIPGDANGDNAVDLLDLDILGANFGLTMGATVAQGDFNEDAAVDLLDLDILGANFGTMGPASATAVPEPTSIVSLLSIGVLAAARRRA